MTEIKKKNSSNTFNSQNFTPFVSGDILRTSKHLNNQQWNSSHKIYGFIGTQYTKTYVEQFRWGYSVYSKNDNENQIFKFPILVLGKHDW